MQVGSEQEEIDFLHNLFESFDSPIRLSDTLSKGGQKASPEYIKLLAKKFTRDKEFKRDVASIRSFFPGGKYNNKTWSDLVRSRSPLIASKVKTFYREVNKIIQAQDSVAYGAKKEVADRIGQYVDPKKPKGEKRPLKSGPQSLKKKVQLRKGAIRSSANVEQEEGPEGVPALPYNPEPGQGQMVEVVPGKKKKKMVKKKKKIPGKGTVVIEDITSGVEEKERSGKAEVEEDPESSQPGLMSSIEYTPEPPLPESKIVEYKKKATEYAMSGKKWLQLVDEMRKEGLSVSQSSQFLKIFDEAEGKKLDQPSVTGNLTRAIEDKKREALKGVKDVATEVAKAGKKGRMEQRAKEQKEGRQRRIADLQHGSDGLVINTATQVVPRKDVPITVNEPIYFAPSDTGLTSHETEYKSTIPTLDNGNTMNRNPDIPYSVGRTSISARGADRIEEPDERILETGSDLKQAGGSQEEVQARIQQILKDIAQGSKEAKLAHKGTFFRFFGSSDFHRQLATYKRAEQSLPDFYQELYEVYREGLSKDQDKRFLEWIKAARDAADNDFEMVDAKDDGIIVPPGAKEKLSASDPIKRALEKTGDYIEKKIDVESISKAAGGAAGAALGYVFGENGYVASAGEAAGVFLGEYIGSKLKYYNQQVNQWLVNQATKVEPPSIANTPLMIAPNAIANTGAIPGVSAGAIAHVPGGGQMVSAAQYGRFDSGHVVEVPKDKGIAPMEASDEELWNVAPFWDLPGVRKYDQRDMGELDPDPLNEFDSRYTVGRGGQNPHFDIDSQMGQSHKPKEQERKREVARRLPPPPPPGTNPGDVEGKYDTQIIDALGFRENAVEQVKPKEVAPREAPPAPARRVKRVKRRVPAPAGEFEYKGDPAGEDAPMLPAEGGGGGGKEEVKGDVPQGVGRWEGDGPREPERKREVARRDEPPAPPAGAAFRPRRIEPVVEEGDPERKGGGRDNPDRPVSMAQNPEDSIPMLRAEFLRGGEERIIGELNMNAVNKQIDRLMWQSFQNYQWEANQESDNVLWHNVMDEEAFRYGYTKPTDPTGEKNETAIDLLRHQDKTMDLFKVEKSLRDKAQFVGFPQLVYEGKTGAVEGTVDFHDVYLPDWDHIPEEHPLNQFTATYGTSLPDSERLGGGKFSSQFFEKYDNVNNWISSTLS